MLLIVKSDLLKRVAKGFGANSFSQLSSVIIQLASLPVFLSFWSMEQYGIWIMISAVPAYVSLSDVGIITVGKNKSVMSFFSGDKESANKTFQSSLLFLNFASAIVALATLAFIGFSAAQNYLSLGTGCALFLLVVSALLSLYTNLWEALYRIVDQYSTGLWITTAARLGEWAGSVAFGLYQGSIFSVAAGALSGRLIVTLYMFLDARRRCGEVVIGTSSADFREIKNLLKPSLTFMAFPVGNAISIQGITLLVGATYGPATLAVFNTYRTLSRVLVQATSMISHSLWPEFTRAYGRSANTTLTKLYKNGILVNTLFSVIVSSTIIIGGELIIKAWSRGKIPYEPYMFQLFVLSAVVGSLWHIPRILAIATNNHERLAIWYALCTVVLIATAKLAVYLNNQITSIVTLLCIFEIVMAAAAFYSAKILLAHLRNDR